MASTARPDPTGRGWARSLPWDLAGTALVIALGAWTVAASIGRADARPLPVLALLVGASSLFVAARLSVRWHEAVVPQLVAIGLAGALLVTYPGILSAGGAPTGYANTNGTLAALGVIAAASAIPLSRGSARLGWAGLALVLVGFVISSQSLAAAAALSVAVVLAAVSLARRDAAVATLGGLVAAWLAVGVTSAVAAGSTAWRLNERDELRTELWARALDLAQEAPLRGHGPGSYAPPDALLDGDLRWAHQEYLQLAAELGVVGLVLLMLVIGWLYTYLWWGRRRGLARTVAGASALTLVALHATVDHIVHTAAVPLTAAVLLGWATADVSGRTSPSLPDHVDQGLSP